VEQRRAFLSGEIKESVKTLTADGFSRFYYMSKILEHISKEHNRRISILDVGGNSPYLYIFLKSLHIDFDLTVIDILPSSEKHTPYDYIQADATSYKFNEKFDVVISIDMLEHVDSNTKSKIVENMMSNSKAYTIIAAPFFEKNIDDAEHSLNELNKQLFSEEHRWLKEHFEMGKPKHEEIVAIIQDHNKEFKRFDTNRLDHWYLSSASNLILRTYSSVADYITEDLNEYYNSNLGKLDDGVLGYRTFYVIHNRASDIDFEELFHVNKSNNREAELGLIQKLLHSVLSVLDEQREEVVLNEFENKEYIRKIVDENKNLIEIKSHFENEFNNLSNSRSVKIMRLGGKAIRLAKNSPQKYVTYAKKVIKNPTKSIQHIKNKAKSSVAIDPQEEYRTWQKLFEPDHKDLEIQAKKQKSLRYRPLISIITPVFNPPAKVLVELIDSMIAQTYDNFELCLGSFETNDATKRILEKYSTKDSRVKVKYFDGNYGIGENSNMCLKFSKGEYVGLLDHDDTLSPDALYEVVVKLNHKKYDFLYSDKDMMNERGERYSPFFKPGYSPELMYSANYLTHFNVMSTKIIKLVGGWNKETDGAQDWDLFLRILEKTDKVAHIPRILYHWRVLSTSTAFSIKTKPYALDAQLLSVNNHLKRIGKPGTARHLEDLSLAVKWNVVNKFHSLDIVFIDRDESSEIAGIIRAQARRLGIVDIKVHHLSSLSLLAESLTIISASAQKVLVIGALVEDINGDVLEQLLGYSQLVGVVAASGQAISSGKIYDAGSILGLGSLFGNMNFGRDIRSTSPIGYMAWNRNFITPSKQLFLLDVEKIPEEDRFFSTDVRSDESLDEFFLRAHSKYGLRSVVVPTVKASVRADSLIRLAPSKEMKKLIEKKTIMTDPFYNSNLSKSDLGVRVMVSKNDTQDRLLDPLFRSINGSENISEARMLNDSFMFSRAFDIDGNTLSDSINLNSSKKEIVIDNIYWVLPEFTGVYAGVNNILFFSNYLRDVHGVNNHFRILGGGHSLQKKLIADIYPELARSSTFDHLLVGEVLNMEQNSVGVATQWPTAYVLANSINSQRNFYFIQDYESDFYSPGTSSALAENTYRFGMWGIANTQGLKSLYEEKYSGRAILLPSKVDLSSFSPDLRAGTEDGKKRVFFYARPFESRNAFELGIEALKIVKEELGDAVEILCAGQGGWEPSDVGAAEYLTNLGKVQLSELPKFYANMDVGLVLMFSHHPGVVPSELMASGVPVVVNMLEEPTWKELYKHGETAYVALPSASSIAEGLLKVLCDEKTSKSLISGGLKMVERYYGDYDNRSKKAFDFMRGIK
jgi:glycosyltransferase involved in cell wall biosynthesis